MDVLLIYLLIINAAGFFSMLADKFFARKNLWRVSEATLLTITLMGGSLGSLVGIYAVRHKTSRPKFTVGIPVILIGQIVFILWIIR